MANTEGIGIRTEETSETMADSMLFEETTECDSNDQTNPAIPTAAKDHNGEQCEMMTGEETPNSYKPECEPEKKPYVGQRFETLQQGVDFYRHYATVVGFNVRSSTTRKTREGDVGVKYMLCSRERQTTTPTIEEQTTQNTKRRCTTNRVGCKARLALRRTPHGLYEVNIFEESHNHCLCLDRARHVLKINRKLNIGHQTFMASCERENIGPTKSFRLFKQFTGSFASIGATSVEFRNCRRDLHEYLIEADDQAVVDKYKKKQEVSPTYTFEYSLDDENQLSRVFWADPTAKTNYACFGDVMAFDATYSTNRYKLVCVPFTGVDNHRKCVTFAMGLISKEDIQSYVWLLETFVRTMGHIPHCTITDQDPAMKVAIAQVFTTTKHRYCMWHIMTKVGEKMGSTLAKNETFRKSLNEAVWDEKLGVAEFEEKWHKVMKEYELEQHKWFTQLHENRYYWIEAYFQDVFIGGLLRTTSRSEAENGVFGESTNHNASLLEFFTQFESARELQRHRNARLEAECEGSLPILKTPLRIEKQAATVYTITVFYDIQREIYEACFTCRIKTTTHADEKTVYTVEDGQMGNYNVAFDKEKATAQCSCGQFNRIGMLYRHIFLILKEERVEVIPSQYILPRWTRNASVHPMYNITGLDNNTHRISGEEELLGGKLWTEFYTCMTLTNGDTTRMKELLTMVQGFKEKITPETLQEQSGTNKSIILETFYGTQVTTNITMKPSQMAKNKGSGKRWKSAKEKAEEIKAKPKRKCRSCNKMVHHDSRNCPESYLQQNNATK